MKRYILNLLPKFLIVTLFLWANVARSQCPLTYYAGIGVANSGTNFATWANFGPGQYFAWPVLNGGSYALSTCGAPVCTQLTGYDNAASSLVFLNTGNGPFCSNCNASINNFIPNFTGYSYVQLTQYYCGAGGSSSINLYLRQNDNLVFTSSSAAMCSGQTRVLSATPGNVGTAPGGYGDPGTFYGTGVSGGVFTAPVVASPTNYTITYAFGYVSHTQVITVNPLPTVVANTTDGSICKGSSTTLFGSGASTYVWTGGVTDNVPFAPTVTGTYFVTGTSAAGCTSTNSAAQTITVEPTLSLTGNGNNVPIGATTNTNNNTNFGTNTSRTFSISNTGAGTLTLGTIFFTGPNAGAFGVTTAPSSTAITTGTTGFVITLTPTNTGISTATVNIPSNHCGATYSFVITASTTAASALGFDGLNDVITTPNINLNNQSFTIEFWSKRNSFAGGSYLIGQNNSNTVNQSLHIGFRNNTAFTFAFWGNDLDYTVTPNFDNNWHHWACVYNSASAGIDRFIYMDGQLVASDNSSSNFLAPSSPVLIGSGNGFAYTGFADEVRIWNTARSQCQIQQFMNCEIPTTASGLLANYHFNQGIPSGNNAALPYNVLTDATGTNNGSLAGFALTGATSNWISPGGVVSGFTTAVSITSSLVINGNGNNVPMGSGTSTNNNTNFGTSTSKTFSITNGGGGTLNINNVYLTGPNAGQFSLTTLPATSITTGTTGFAITLTPTNSGISTATVFINSNDCTNPTFSFVITASTTPANALSFNGAQYFVTPALVAAITSTSNITLETWFKPTGPGVIVNELGSPSLNGSPSGWHDSQIEVVGSGSVFVRVWNITAVFVGTVSFGTWNHVALRYNHTLGVTDGLLNGVPSASVSFGTRFAPSSLYYGLGMTDVTNMGSGAYFTGQMDEFRIWNTHRSVCEIQQYMNCEIPTTATGLVANYHFNQGVPSGLNTSVNTATDAANGNTATLSGFALTGSLSNWVNPGSVTAGSITPATVAATLTVKGNGVSIPQGSTTSTSNNTDWGSSTSKTFSITNTGSGTLNIGHIYLTGTNASNFSLTTLPALSVTSGTTGFVVALSPTNTGISTTTVNIVSNDCAYPTFTFVITASTTPASALDFDGVDDYVSVPHSAALSPTNALSVELWVKPTTTVGTQYLLSKGTDDLVNGQYGIILANGAPSFHFYNNAHVGAGSSTYTLTSGAWTHLAGTWDGSTANLYANGVLIASSSVTAALPVNTGALQIGRLGKPSFIYPSNAQFDEIRIWNTGRTQCQIQQYMNCEITSTASGLVANYHFNEGIPAGTNTVVPYTGLSDATGSFPGTLNNFALTGTVSNWVSPGGVISGSNTPASITSSLLVSGNGNTVPLGNTTSTGNNTDFGTNASRTFSISNPGGGTLYINSVYLTGPNVNQFSLTTLPASSISTGTTGFAITLTPTNTGISTATVFINSNDCTNPTFSFVITASTTPASALNFDGVNDGVNLGTSINTTFDPLNTITAEAWVFPTNTTYLGVVLGNWASPSSNMQFMIRRENTQWTFWVDDGSQHYAQSAINTVTTNVWQHVAGVWDGSQMRLYINGVLKATTPGVTGSSFATVTNSLTIGYNSFSENFTGSIDEVRLWTVPRTQCQIQSFMNAEITSTASGLLANYHFNQGIPAGTNSLVPYNSLTDATGSNTGTLINMALSGATSNWVSPGGVVSGFSTTSAPSITVAAFGNGNSIPAGSTTPTVSNNTSFGNLCVGGSTVSKTYSVSNTGTNVLNINIVLSGSSAYTLGTFPATIAAGGSTTFPITFNPGTSTAIAVTTVNVYSNDCANPNYSFVINATVNPLPVVSASTSSAAICIGQSVTLNGSGANTYTWVASTGTATDNLAFSPTTTASYSVAGTSTAGCTSTNVAAVSVTVNALPTLTISGTGTICNSFSSTLTASGASTYTWNTGPTTASVALNPSTTTVYTATGTDVNACVNTKSFTITVNPLPVVSASTNSSVICFGQSVTLNGSGANTYIWLASSGTATNNVAFTPTSTASYSVTGTSTAGCTSTNVAAVTVTVNALPVVSASTNSTAICLGQSVTLNGSGANTYTWVASTGTATNNLAFSPTTTATYSVTGTSTAGCTSTNVAALSVTVNPLPTLTISGTGTICNSFASTLTASGANTYTWNTGPTTASVVLNPSTTTVYTATGTDVNSCVNTKSFTITVNPLPVVSASTNSSVICFGQSVTLNGSGANTYTWLASSGTATNNVAFTPTITASYSVTGTSTAGCTSTNIAAVTVTVNALPIVSASTNSTVICFGQSVTLNGSGANTYTWNASSGTATNNLAFTPTTTANYSVAGTSTLTGCTSTNVAAVTVTVNALPIVSANSTSTFICLGTPVTLNGGGANTYTWVASSGTATNNTAFSPTVTASYSVTGTSTLTGCTSTNVAAITVTVNSIPSVTASASSSVICNTQTITVNGSGANTYTWTATSGTATNAIAFAPSLTATYSVVGTSTAGCTSTNVAAVTVTVNALPVVSASSSSSVICNTQTITVNGSGANTYTWNASTGTATNGVVFSPSATANYSVTGTNTLTGCTSTNAAAVTVTVNALPTLTANTTSPAICFGQTVSVFAFGANTFTWSASAGSNPLNGIPFNPTVTASYTVSGTNTLTGCTNSNVAAVTVTVNSLPVVSAAASSSVICNTQTISVNGSGANTYTWIASTGTTTNAVAFSPSATANYSVSGTNTLTGCTSTNVAAVTVTVNALPSLTIAGTGTICNTFSSTLTVSGASTYTWNTGPVSNSIVVSPSVTTTYTATGTNSNSCVNTNTFALTVNPLPTVTANSTGTYICINNNITLNGSGANTYTWTSTAAGTYTNGVSFTPTTSATYSVVGTSTNGCVSSNTSAITVTVNALPVVSAATSTAVICIGGTTSVNGSGANTYTWTGGVSNSVTFAPTSTQTYSLSGTNTITGCTSTNVANVTVTVNPLPTLTISGSALICNGGGVTLTASGANTYSWSNSVNNASVALTPSVTTPYTVTATDVNQCVNSSVKTVTVNSLPTVTASVTSSVICAGASVTVNGSGAVTYTWNASTGTATNGIAFAPASTASYSLVGTNAAGCTSTNNAVVSVTVNALPVLSIAGTPSICNGASRNFSVSGANTYIWNTSSTSSVITVSPSANTNYSVTGTNTTTSCQNTTAITLSVTQLPTVTAGATSSVICINGTTSLSAGGASTYTWSSATATIANLTTISPTTTTSYTVIGTNTAGCSSTNTAVQTITVNPLPVVTANASNTYICINTSVTVNGSGANTYTWTTTAPGSYSNAVAFVPTITATYSLAGTSTAGCTSTNNAVVTITVNALPVISIAGTPTICNGAATTFSASGADTYTWNTSANTASINAAPNANTIYTVTGTNTLTSCQGTAGITLSVSPLPTVSAAASNTVICYGNTVTLNGNGANSYAWTASTGTATNNVAFTPTATANYTVVGTSTAGCTSTNVAAVTITVNQLPVVVASASNTFICINASVTVNGSGANTYTWTASTGAVTNNIAFNPTTTATYSLAGTSTAGCTSTNVANITITVNPLPTITAVATSSAICLGASLTLSGAGASTYTWNNAVVNAVAFSPTVTQSYTVTGTNSNSCVNSTTISIPVYQNPTVSATASNTFICVGNSVIVNGGGANTYTWTASTGTATDNTAFTPTTTASYSVVGTSTDGCVSNNTAVVTITVNALPTLSITSTKSVLCLGDSTSFVASGALTYTWSSALSNGVYFHPTLTATSYTVDATDVNGCKNSAINTITINPLPVLSVAPSVSASCSGQSTTLTATGATSYSWSIAAATGSTAVFAPTVSATYTLTGMDNNVCVSVISFSQPVNPCLARDTAYATVTPASCKGRDDGRILITALNPTYTNNTISYVWNPNALCPNNNCDGFTNLLAGNYAVKVIFTYTVASNLVRVDTIAINNIVVADGTAACDLTPYTGVTPNNDGKNDKWEIINIDLYPNNRVSVYNRLGTSVADIRGYDNETKFWPQVQSLNKLPADTYFYIIDPGDGSALIKGWVELIKE